MANDSVKKLPVTMMTDSRGRIWKRNEYGNLCIVLPSEYRNIFLLRRKKLTYKAIGNIYQIHHNQVRKIFFRYVRRRRFKVLEYLRSRSNRKNND